MLFMKGISSACEWFFIWDGYLETLNKIFQNVNKLKTFTDTLHLRVFYMFVYNKNGVLKGFIPHSIFRMKRKSWWNKFCVISLLTLVETILTLSKLESVIVLCGSRKLFFLNILVLHNLFLDTSGCISLQMPDCYVTSFQI